ncbi:MAG: pantoate--beta-alanine ligase [Pirellulaceae bacterium]
MHPISAPPAPPQVIDSCLALQRAVQALRGVGKRIGVVPTMGALHEGHLSLVRASRAECDVTIATIFVNPTQFGPGEDLDRYPRQLARDLEMLGELGVEIVFAPAAGEMYPPGFSTSVEPPASARPLEGECRPGHFAGVATVVLKLLNLAGADRAYFGHKDYQQSVVVRHMVRDLNVPCEIVVCPTVRESDGLALSSRNAYLSDEERRRALSISRGLRRAKELVTAGERDANTVRGAMQQVLLEAEVTDVDYVALVEPESLEALACLDREFVALIAARVGKTRLIDNLRISPS